MLLRKMASSLEKGSLNERAFYHFVAAWGALLREDIPHALQHAKDQLKWITIEQCPSWKMFLAKFMMAQALHEKGEDQKVNEYLSQAHQFAVQSKSPFFEYICHISRAQFALDRGNEGSCLKALSQAMAIGREKEIVNFWGWRLDVMAKLCAKALENGIETGYVQMLIQKRKISFDPPPLLENWPWPIKVYTLGQFKVVRDGTPVQFTGRAQRKPLELLKVLIALEGRGIKIGRISEVLWGDAEEDSIYSAFTTTLMRLRKIIGSEVILSKGKHLTIDPRYCWVDVWTFKHLLESIDKSNPATPEFWRHIEKIMAFYQGPFLEGEEDYPEITLFRNRLRSRFLGKIHKMGLRLEKARQHEKAIALYKMALEAEPLGEELYRYLMVGYSLMDQQSEVQKVYQCCKQTLWANSRMKLSQETEKLLQKLVEKQG